MADCDVGQALCGNSGAGGRDGTCILDANHDGAFTTVAYVVPEAYPTLGADIGGGFGRGADVL